EPIVTDTDRKSGVREDLPKDGKYDAVPITSRVTKLFLGIQSQCTQCHDHPHNKEYLQSDFWGVNAFFRQADRSGTTNPRNLGRGLNKEPTVDDFSMNNELVHPELLNYLAEQFKQYNYDPKRLLEWICNSDVYQLSHVANKAYAESKFDAYFARMPLKAMSPEV